MQKYLFLFYCIPLLQAHPFHWSYFSTILLHFTHHRENKDRSDYLGHWTKQQASKSSKGSLPRSRGGDPHQSTTLWIAPGSSFTHSRSLERHVAGGIAEHEREDRNPTSSPTVPPEPGLHCACPGGHPCERCRHENAATTQPTTV